MTQIKIVFFLLAMFISILGWMIYNMEVNFDNKQKACYDKGGILIETNQGLLCAKIEKIL